MSDVSVLHGAVTVQCNSSAMTHLPTQHVGIRDVGERGYVVRSGMHLPVDHHGDGNLSALKITPNVVERRILPREREHVTPGRWTIVGQDKLTPRFMFNHLAPSNACLFLPY
ncbi:MAG: hypothetical protein ABR880_23430 [Candidatus Sulfotelmatobacter sp.]|jgi:hypothetical protein